MSDRDSVRRLANQNNPDTAIVNEDVIFVRKP